jgi:hypothetical protein
MCSRGARCWDRESSWHRMISGELSSGAVCENLSPRKATKVHEGSDLTETGALRSLGFACDRWFGLLAYDFVYEKQVG